MAKNKIKIIRSEEIPVNENIVSKIYSAGKLLGKMARASGITEPLDMVVFSNMTGHPKSGAFEIGTKGLNQQKIGTLRKLAESIFGPVSETDKNSMFWG